MGVNNGIVNSLVLNTWIEFIEARGFRIDEIIFKKDNRSDKQELMSVINSGPNNSFHNRIWILKTIKDHVIDHGIKW
jgi:hypothetical protein